MIPLLVVQIYDLSRDALSPCFYFLVPSGKIRDACFIISDEETRTLVLMSSAGYLYTQPMEEASEARDGPFYVTNVLEVKHDDLKVGQGSKNLLRVINSTFSCVQYSSV